MNDLPIIADLSISNKTSTYEIKAKHRYIQITKGYTYYIKAKIRANMGNRKYLFVNTVNDFQSILMARIGAEVIFLQNADKLLRSIENDPFLTAEFLSGKNQYIILGKINVKNSRIIDRFTYNSYKIVKDLNRKGQHNETLYRLEQQNT